MYQTMILSGSEKSANQGYVNLTHNFKVVMEFISKTCKKIICRKLNVVSKLLGLIRRNLNFNAVLRKFQGENKK